MKTNHIILGLLLFSQSLFSCTSNGNAEEKTVDESQGPESATSTSSEVIILNKWELPEVLKEVSGIAYLEENRFACVQDEDGKIFIYNTGTSKIEKEISFGSEGDYEGLSVVGNNIYVARSDGKIFEIADWEGNSPQIKEYATSLTEEHNVEGLCLDQQNNRLLLAIKDDEPGNKNYKGIYSFDLAAKKMDKEPLLRIDLNDPLFNEDKGKKKSKKFKPSEIGVHPKTGDIYLTEGPESRLLIMDKSGKIKRLIQMDENNFPQAEGITFSPQGDIFISNEGNKGPANILQVSISD